MAKARENAAVVQRCSRSTPDDGDREWRSSYNFAGQRNPPRGSWSLRTVCSDRSSSSRGCASTAELQREHRAERRPHRANARSGAGKSSAGSRFPGPDARVSPQPPFVCGPQEVAFRASSMRPPRLGPESGARIMAMPSATGDLTTTTSSASSGASTPASATG